MSSKALVCTYQAISGAGKTFDRMPEIMDNVIPYIGGEEEKSEREPLKLWGHIEGAQIVNAEKPVITAQCFRVPVSDGHTAAVFVSFEKKPSKEEILKAWADFRGPAQELELPSAPKQFLHYFEETDRPQPKLDRNTEHGMAVCIGPSAGRYPVRLQVCLHEPQHPARCGRRSCAAGRTAGSQGLFRLICAFLRTNALQRSFCYEESCFYRCRYCHHHPDVRGRQHQF